MTTLEDQIKKLDKIISGKSFVEPMALALLLRDHLLAQALAEKKEINVALFDEIVRIKEENRQLREQRDNLLQSNNEFEERARNAQRALTEQSEVVKGVARLREDMIAKQRKALVWILENKGAHPSNIEAVIRDCIAVS